MKRIYVAMVLVVAVASGGAYRAGRAAGESNTAAIMAEYAHARMDMMVASTSPGKPSNAPKRVMNAYAKVVDNDDAARQVMSYQAWKIERGDNSTAIAELSLLQAAQNQKMIALLKTIAAKK